MLIEDLSNKEFAWNSIKKLQSLKARWLEIKGMEILNFGSITFHFK